MPGTAWRSYVLSPSSRRTAPATRTRRWPASRASRGRPCASLCSPSAPSRRADRARQRLPRVVGEAGGVAGVLGVGVLTVELEPERGQIRARGLAVQAERDLPFVRAHDPGPLGAL